MILEIMFFIFSRWQLANMINYQKHKILYADAVGRNEKHYHFKAEILRLFDFPNGHRRHLLFLKSPIFWLMAIKTHEHVKFWQNRSIGCKDS